MTVLSHGSARVVILFFIEIELHKLKVLEKNSTYMLKNWYSLYMFASKLLLLWRIKKMFFINFAKIEFIFIFYTKNRLSMCVFIFSTIYQICKTKFYVFWTQACRNLKYIKFSNSVSITCL